MGKIMRSIFITLTAAVLSVAGLTVAASADEAMSAKIPVAISLEGTLPETEEKFEVVLKADDAENPMPSGSVDGTCGITLSGEERKSFPAVYFSELGVYHYTIQQAAGSEETCTYDETKYHLTVYVTNAEDGGLGLTSVLYRENESEKLDCAVFCNVYETKEPETEPVEEETKKPETERVTEKPAKTEDKTQNGSGPKTGDETPVGLYTVIAIIALLTVVGVIVRNKKKQGV